jgi:transcriptional regulator with XRE-family HTH domain
MRAITKEAAMAEVLAARPRTLRQLREAAKMTQRDVADKMGINPSRVGQIEAKYPGVRYDVLVRYLQAIGGHLRINIGELQVNVDELIPDPKLRGTRESLEEKNARYLVKLNAERTRSAKELPLQGDQAQPGGDDTGRDVDHPDAQRNQGDGRQRQEP